MSKRVLLAGLFHETNTFVGGTTPLRSFDVRRDPEMWEAEGDASPLAGALAVALERGWDVLPVIDMRAMPSATVADEVVDCFWDAFQSASRREASGGVDGIFLVLHGAMVSESLLDVEGEILRRIRELPGLGDVPLCGVVDLHANVTPAMARLSNGLIAYRENPHTDAENAARDGAYLLDRLMRTGEKAVTLFGQAGIVWPPTGTGTADDPMRALEARARAVESEDPDILAVNVHAGFSFADTPDTGVSFTATTVGDPEAAQARLRELHELAWTKRADGIRAGFALNDAVHRLRGQTRGPILLVEPADNIGGGAPGDLTHVLKALVENGVENAGVIINDPETVSALASHSPGAVIRAEIGGKSGTVGAEPMQLEVGLVSKSDGRFALEDSQSHLASLFGREIDMGPCAVVRANGVWILLTSRKTPPFDLGQWRSQGIDPESLSVIGVKAAVAHRRAYDPIAAASYTVDTPGPCSENLSCLPFKRIRRPIFPLDDQQST